MQRHLYRMSDNLSTRRSTTTLLRLLHFGMQHRLRHGGERRSGSEAGGGGAAPPRHRATLAAKVRFSKLVKVILGGLHEIVDLARI